MTRAGALVKSISLCATVGFCVVLLLAACGHGDSDAGDEHDGNESSGEHSEPTESSGEHDESTNGLLRQYFPKGTDLSRHSREDLESVALALNTRPRKTLNWRTPAEALDQLLHCAQQDSVATTP